MNRQLLFKLTATVGIGLLLVSTIWAGADGSVNLGWHVLASGGGAAHSAGYAVYHTVGQALVGPAQGTALRLGTGFWYGITEPAAPVPGMRLYLPAVIKG